MTFSHSRRVILPLVLMAGLVPGVALADAKSDFQARYAQLQTAWDTREPEQIKPLLTPDFTAIDIGGRKQTADEMIDRLAMIPVDPDRTEKTTVEAAVVQGDTAQITQRKEAGGSREGRDGKQHTMSFVTVSQDTWISGPKGWLLKTTEAQDMTLTRDGQVMRHMKKGDPMPEGGFRGRGPGGRRPGGFGGDRGGPPPGGPQGDMAPPPPPPGEDE